MNPPHEDRSGYQWLAPLLLRRPGLVERLVRARRWLAELPRPRQTRLLRRLGLSASATALLLAMAGALSNPAARAETNAPDYTITVVNGQVGIAPDKKCSLIEAIVNANDTATGRPHTDCAAGNPKGADTIVLPKDGLFTLTAVHNAGDKGKNGLPWITSVVTIDGNDSIIRRAPSAPAFRLFAVGQKGTLSLDSVTLTGGKVDWKEELGWGTDGAAILTENSVMVRNSLVTGNDGDAISMMLGRYGPSGTASIQNSIITVNNGAGISSDCFLCYYEGYFPTVEVLSSEISGNTSGVVASFGDARIRNTTLSGNSGDGLYLFAVDAYIYKTTVSANDVGLDLFRMDAVISEVTVSMNRRFGVSAIDSHVRISTSIVSGNGEFSTDPRGGREVFAYNYYTNSGSMNDLGNLFGHSGLSAVDAFYKFTPSDQSIVATIDGNEPTRLDRILDTELHDNGGPTLTHALVSGSPAIDAVRDYMCRGPFDQRGEPFQRIVDGDGVTSTNECDMGAYEFQPSAAADTSFFVTTLSSGTVAGLPFEKRDILKWDGSRWSVFFDGSERGLPTTADFSAFFVANKDTQSIVTAFTANTTLPGAGAVAPQDLALYDSRGWTLRFDGSDVGLTTAGEKIDAVHVLPGEVSPIGSSCQKYILVSTAGAGQVTGHNGTALKFGGEDVIGFCATSLNANTTGSWHMVLDGSAEGLKANATFSLSASDDGRTLYLTTKGLFAADGVSGNQSQVFKFNRDTGKFSGSVWKSADHGLAAKMDGLDIRGTLP